MRRPANLPRVDAYLLLKFVHVLLAIFALGSNLTCGIWMAVAGGDRHRIASTTIDVVVIVFLMVVKPTF